jgi:hypothetical protein
VELPEWDLEFAHQEEEIADAEPLPELCELEKAASGEMLGWNARCVKVFLQFENAATGNTTIALNNTSALRKTEAAADSLVNAGRMQREIAVIRQDLLNESRAAHMRDKWFYRALLVIIGVGAVL